MAFGGALAPGGASAQWGGHRPALTRSAWELVVVLVLLGEPCPEDPDGGSQ